MIGANSRIELFTARHSPQNCRNQRNLRFYERSMRKTADSYAPFTGRLFCGWAKVIVITPLATLILFGFGSGRGFTGG